MLFSLHPNISLIIHPVLTNQYISYSMAIFSANDIRTLFVRGYSECKISNSNEYSFYNPIQNPFWTSNQSSNPNLDRTSTKLQPNFNQTSTELRLNFDRTSTELRPRPNFDQTLTEHQPNCDRSLTRPRLNLDRASNKPWPNLDWTSTKPQPNRI